MRPLHALLIVIAAVVMPACTPQPEPPLEVVPIDPRMCLVFDGERYHEVPC